jgi:hypothetical protein
VGAELRCRDCLHPLHYLALLERKIHQAAPLVGWDRILALGRRILASRWRRSPGGMFERLRDNHGYAGGIIIV